MRRKHRIKIRGGGYVQLIDFLGSDTKIAQAARMSTGRQNSKDNIEGLLAYLYRNRHTSPFEQASITYEFKMPLFIARQFFRHRTFRPNEASARYCAVDADWWKPTPDMLRKQNTDGNKQGSHQGEWMDYERWNMINMLDEVATHAFASYKELLKMGLAREQARVVLPMSTFTSLRVNCDVHNLMGYFKQRLHHHAQEEIREMSDAMYQIFKGLFPITAGLFTRFKVEVIDTKVTNMEAAA